MELGDMFVYPPIWIPSPLRWQNYTEAFQVVTFARFYLNSTIIVSTALLGTILTTSAAGYSFARFRWPGRDLVFGALLMSMMLPYAVVLIPQFALWRKLGGINTFYPLIVPSWMAGGAWGVFNLFLFRQFFMTIPYELDDAAYIDGASYIQIYSRVIMPLSKPALAVVCIFTFKTAWNDFIRPLVYLNDPDKFTVSIGLALFQSLYSANWNLLLAAAFMAFVPILLLFIFFQRYFVEGIAVTGLKG
jgi:multiple sugar transport system permease protein